MFTSFSVKFKATTVTGVEGGGAGGGGGGEGDDELAEVSSPPPPPPLQLGAAVPNTMRTAIAT
jgi:hypothetical protein